MSRIDEMVNKVRTRRSGVVVPKTGTHQATPWREATTDGEYVGLDGSVWLYRVVKNQPLRFSDPDQVLDHGKRMVSLISEIGSSSIAAPSRFVDAPAGWYRDMHIAAIRWEERPAPPADTRTNEHRSWLEGNVLNQLESPQQLMFIGVKLSDIDGKTAKNAESPFDLAKFYIDRLLNDRAADFDAYDEDRKWVNSVLLNKGCRVPTEQELRWLEAWFNNGSHTEPTVLPFEDHILVGPERERIEFAALERTTDEGKVLRAPYREWLADVLDHRDGPQCVSMRFELMPPQDVRKALRRSVKQREIEQEEARKHGVMDRVEEHQEHQLTRYAETRYASKDAGPALRNLSVIFGKRDRGRVNQTYTNFLRDEYGIVTRPLTHRQIQALEEVQPCAQRRANPFHRAANVNTIAYAGLGMFTHLGDTSGAFLGLGLPEGVPTWLDFRRNTEERAVPPVTAVVGVPGSGKAIGVDELVSTADGWKRMGDIVVGDRVHGTDGTLKEVIGVYPQGENPLYEVETSDGRIVLADAEHHWVTSSRPRSNNEDGWVKRTTLELLGALDEGERLYLPSIGAVTYDTNDADLPLDPYLLGLLLGDGGFAGGYPTFSSDDPELVDAVRRLVPDGLTLNKDSRKHDWTIASENGRTGPLTVLLDGWGINGLRRREMFVPDHIVNGTDNERRQFLAAVLKMSKPSTIWDVVEIRSTSDKVRAAVCEMANDLGYDFRDQTANGIVSVSTAVHDTLADVVPSADIQFLAYVVFRGTTADSHTLWLSQFADPDLREDLARVAPDGCEIIPFGKGNTSAVRINHRQKNPLVAALEELDLWGKGSHEKHIPNRYLTASPSARKALTQGLMDTDGGMRNLRNKSGRSSSTEFTSTSQELAEGLRLLVESLGGNAKITTRIPKCRRTTDAPDAPYREGRLAYRVIPRFPEGIAPFRLNRKASSYQYNPKCPPRREIVSITAAGRGDTQCIYVDADDHLFLTRGFIPTSNTYMSMNLALQACLSGLDVHFVNPKGEDTLAQVLPYFASHGIEVEWTAVSQLLRDEAIGVGMYDPFRYARYPETAADLASTLIMTVVDIKNQQQRGELRAGLLRGAKAGAGCAMGALEYVNDAEVVHAVQQMWETSPLFRLGLADRPLPRVVSSEETVRRARPGRFTLTEFDVPLNLPAGVKSEYTDPERNALAAIHAVTSASIGMLSASAGGVYMMDEAHNVLGHPELVQHVQKVAREGRSLGVAQVYITQQVSDVLSVRGAGGADGSMRSYISRVIGLQMTDENEAAATLKLMGIEPRAERISDMRGFNPQPTADGDYTPAYGYFQDIEGRTTIMQFGPYGDDFGDAMRSTVDREAIARMFARSARNTEDAR